MQTLGTLGVDPASFAQDDGSGLSRHNMVCSHCNSTLHSTNANLMCAPQLSPESLANTLHGLQTVLSPERFKLFKSFLPLAGKSGSLINRCAMTTKSCRPQKSPSPHLACHHTP
jgi:D-alanyl-D-alanine carboxypeptidase